MTSANIDLDRQKTCTLHKLVLLGQNELVGSLNLVHNINTSIETKGTLIKERNVSRKFENISIQKNKWIDSKWIVRKMGEMRTVRLASPKLSVPS